MSLVSRSLIRHPYFRALERFRGLASPHTSEPDGCILLAFRFASANTTDKHPPKATPPKHAKELVHGEQRSYLEEVFIKREQEPKTTAQKVKKKAENTFYYSVAALSVAAFGALAYFLLEQFFASDSPQRIYSKSLKMIQDDERCLAVLGEKIAGHGEDTGRGRRRHIAHHRFSKDGQDRVRIMFHVKGSRTSGKAFTEMAQVDGSWQYRFLLVETSHFPPETIVLVDNR